ncbi:hypothetical protein KIK06_09845 [Nocardiopsis sp. EMB25]|uniref:hypothetical protein n=1 Tax=Nocardiopsis sp. EMB25 TaxID=2835867 RepID=UPI0022844788|nr:hypothetical protein [Nocardiopsis sp. EMB25]MCY9784195.1 hypothetical protein [Nocardiopsis sp. EMB25]
MAVAQFGQGGCVGTVAHPQAVGVHPFDSETVGQQAVVEHVLDETQAFPGLFSAFKLT